MENSNWRRFAANQNGQNIRLKSSLDYIYDSEELTERLDYDDPFMRETLQNLKYNLNQLKCKLNEAIEKNNYLKEIVQQDYYKNKSYQFTITNVKKCETDNKRWAAVTLEIKLDDRLVICHEIIPLHKSNKETLYRFFKSIGSVEEDNGIRMNWNNLEGRQGNCSVNLINNNFKVQKFLLPEEINV